MLESDKNQKDDLGLSLFFEDSRKKILASANDLEINILFVCDQYQEVEIIYNGKRKKRKLTKFLPEYFANNFAQLQESTRPSSSVGATNIGNLSLGNNLVLKEKFLRILSKINNVSEIKTAEKIWDSDERISTADKAILLAVVNRVSPANEKLDRAIVSERSYEIEDQESFKKFIQAAIDLTRNSKNLANFLFPDVMKKLPEEKQSFLTGCLRNILSETDETKCVHQIKFLEKIIGEVTRSATRNF
jgi:hypothetical protein